MDSIQQTWLIDSSFDRDRDMVAKQREIVTPIGDQNTERKKIDVKNIERRTLKNSIDEKNVDVKNSEILKTRSKDWNEELHEKKGRVNTVVSILAQPHYHRHPSFSNLTCKTSNARRYDSLDPRLNVVESLSTMIFVSLNNSIIWSSSKRDLSFE